MNGPIRSKLKGDSAAMRLLFDAFRIYSETGSSSIACDRCHGIIQFNQIADGAYESTCPCGKYRDTFRGI